AIFHYPAIDRGGDRGGLPARLGKLISFTMAETGIESHLRLPIIGIVRAVDRIDIGVLFIDIIRKKQNKLFAGEYRHTTAIASSAMVVDERWEKEEDGDGR